MSFKDRTKQLFADAIKEMLKTKSLHEIRVKDLCAQCDTERQTFYYHFKDKYDLIAWIYSKEIEKSIQECNGFYCKEQLEMHLIHLREHQLFYKKAFEDTTQNALMHYVRQINIDITETVLKKRLCTDTLDDEILFAVNFNSHAWIGSIIDWVTGKTRLSAAEYAKFMYQNTTILNTPILLEETKK